MPEAEWDAYTLDQRINDTGINLDRTFADAAVVLDDRHREATLTKARELTGLENPNSPIQLKEWLTTHGCEIDPLAKADVEAALDTASGVVREVLELRGDLAKSSVKKYQAMHNVAGSDGRARGLITLSTWRRDSGSGSTCITMKARWRVLSKSSPRSSGGMTSSANGQRSIPISSSHSMHAQSKRFGTSLPGLWRRTRNPLPMSSSGRRIQHSSPTEPHTDTQSSHRKSVDQGRRNASKSPTHVTLSTLIT